MTRDWGNMFVITEIRYTIVLFSNILIVSLGGLKNIARFTGDFVVKGFV